jgi:two-component system, OmpR family, response regulator QseB
MRILVVEDDLLLGDGLASGLRSVGFVVDWFRTGDEAERALEGAPYDAIVLDLGLPGRDGLAWLARWRARGDVVPVLILTAREALESRVEGLDAGADDYLVKPIALEELAARLRAIGRRASGRPETVWRHGALEYSPAGRSARWHGEPVELTAREALLLELFLASPGRVLTRQQIQDKLYGWGEELESNALEVYVHHLRRKFSPRIVRTVRGLGYALGPAEVTEQPS